MTGDANKPMSQVMTEHPAPWTYSIFNGVVTMRDAAGAEVPLFTVLNVAVGVSRAMAAQKQPASATPA